MNESSPLSLEHFQSHPPLQFSPRPWPALTSHSRHYSSHPDRRQLSPVTSAITVLPRTAASSHQSQPPLQFSPGLPPALTCIISRGSCVGSVLLLPFQSVFLFCCQSGPFQRKIYHLTSLTKGFLGGSAGKESACNVGALGSIPGLEDPLKKGKATTPVFWPGDFHGLYSPWGHRESDMTERLSLFFTKTLQRLVFSFWIWILCCGLWCFPLSVPWCMLWLHLWSLSLPTPPHSVSALGFPCSSLSKSGSLFVTSGSLHLLFLLHGPIQPAILGRTDAASGREARAGQIIRGSTEPEGT